MVETISRAFSTQSLYKMMFGNVGVYSGFNQTSRQSLNRTSFTAEKRTGFTVKLLYLDYRSTINLYIFCI